MSTPDTPTIASNLAYMARLTDIVENGLVARAEVKASSMRTSHRHRELAKRIRAPRHSTRKGGHMRYLDKYMPLFHPTIPVLPQYFSALPQVLSALDFILELFLPVNPGFSGSTTFRF